MNNGFPVSDVVAIAARGAGLQKALQEFPEDVALAAEGAAQAVALLVMPTDPLIEPWPPMRVQAT